MAKRSRSGSMSSDRHNDDGSIERTTKYASLEPEEVVPQSSTMHCLLPPHKPTSFNSYAEYETHYNQAHINRCNECKNNFPTSHFLDLHIAENHDPIVAAKRDRGEKTYGCFVEGCEKITLDWKKRRSHLVDKHGFPRNYDFFTVNNGVDGRRSMLRPGVDAQGHRRSSRERSSSSVTVEVQSTEATSPHSPGGGDVVRTAASTSGNGKEAKRDVSPSSDKAADGVDELASSMSVLNMVPRSITFGKRRVRAGFAKS